MVVVEERSREMGWGLILTVGAELFLCFLLRNDDYSSFVVQRDNKDTECMYRIAEGMGRKKKSSGWKKGWIQQVRTQRTAHRKAKQKGPEKGTELDG